MRTEEEFEELYSQLSGSRPLYKSLKQITSGIPRWRLHVFEKGTAPTGGDREILCIERPIQEECLKEGMQPLRRSMNLIKADHTGMEER